MLLGGLCCRTFAQSQSLSIPDGTDILKGNTPPGPFPVLSAEDTAVNSTVKISSPVILSMHEITGLQIKGTLTFSLVTYINN